MGMTSENSVVTEEEITQAKSLAWLCYLGIFFIVPLLIYPTNRFVRHHVGQGLSLMIARIIFAMAYLAGFMLLYIAMFVPMVLIGVLQQEGGDWAGATVLMVLGGIIFIFLAVVLVCACLLAAAAIAGIVTAISGKLWVIPIMGRMGVWMKLSVDPRKSKEISADPG